MAGRRHDAAPQGRSRAAMISSAQPVRHLLLRQTLSMQKRRWSGPVLVIVLRYR
jgi:hypothetical protein